MPSLVEIAWPYDFEDEDFKISLVFFLVFSNYLPLEKDLALHLNKLETPSPKNALCQDRLTGAKQNAPFFPKGA